jgi:hypothetical protein
MRGRRFGCTVDCTGSMQGRTFARTYGLDLGAGERDRTADLPFTRRLLCQLSYTGGRLVHGSRTRT